jgi:hypothetical protein
LEEIQRHLIGHRPVKEPDGHIRESGRG